MTVSTGIHPLRWRVTRPFSNAVVSIVKQKVRFGMIGMDLLNEVFGLVMPAYNDGIMRVPFERRPANIRGMQQEGSLALHAARFFTMGRNVFELSPGLAQVLSQTSLKGVRMADVKLPHAFFYVSLAGLGCGGLPGEGNEIDGAYVDGTLLEHGKLQIVVTSRRTDASNTSSKTWPFNRDPYFYLPLETSEDGEKTFEEMIAEAVASGEIPFDADGIWPDDDEGVAEPEVHVLSDGRPVAVSSVKEREDRREAISSAQALPNVKKALALVVNALAWLSAEPDDGEAAFAWPEDAPTMMVRAAQEAKSPKQIRKSFDALAEKGFSRIRILGHRVEPLNLAYMRETGRELAQAHWRIGHHRSQPHGPANSLRKRVWIRPVLVRPDLPLDTETGGHQYVLG
jgi:hypothetical protein